MRLYTSIQFLFAYTFYTLTINEKMTLLLSGCVACDAWSTHSGDRQRVVLARARTARCHRTQNAGVDHAGPAKTTASTS